MGGIPTVGRLEILPSRAKLVQWNGSRRTDAMKDFTKMSPKSVDLLVGVRKNDKGLSKSAKPSGGK